MAKTIRTEIKIKATPEKVWQVLIDFENYPKWNPFIISLQGDVEIGNKITVTIKPPNAGSMTFKPTVLTKTANKKLSWLGTALFKGLFDGEHVFELIDHQDGTTTFVQSEAFSGILVRLFNLQQTENGFKKMNEKLKELVEKQNL